MGNFPLPWKILGGCCRIIGGIHPPWIYTNVYYRRWWANKIAEGGDGVFKCGSLASNSCACTASYVYNKIDLDTMEDIFTLLMLAKAQFTVNFLSEHVRQMETLKSTYRPSRVRYDRGPPGPPGQKGPPGPPGGSRSFSKWFDCLTNYLTVKH